MSSIMIRDLSHSKELDRSEMSAVHGGTGYGKFADVKVNVGIVQNMVQYQNIEVNALNNIGVLGANLPQLNLDVSPKQIDKLNASPTVLT